MASKITVFNRVLNQLGVTEPLVTENDVTPNGVILRNNFDDIFYSLLEAANWDFATGWSTLTLISTGVNDSPYINKYAWPLDFLKDQQLLDGDGQLLTDYIKASDGLYTDSGVVKLRYTKRLPSEALASAPSSFVEALVFRLAQSVASAFVGSTNRQDFLMKEANKHLATSSSQTVPNGEMYYTLESDIVSGRPW